LSIVSGPIWMGLSVVMVELPKKQAAPVASMGLESKNGDGDPSLPCYVGYFLSKVRKVRGSDQI
jgi:hypothetical protein